MDKIALIKTRALRVYIGRLWIQRYEDFNAGNSRDSALTVLSL